MREQNALPYDNGIRVGLTAKPDVDNVGAGRAAKSASPFIRTINNSHTRKSAPLKAQVPSFYKKRTPSGVLFLTFNI